LVWIKRRFREVAIGADGDLRFVLGF